MTRMPFRVLPVLDLKQGRVVHALGGRREQYQAIQSVLCPDPQPIPLACALRDALGLTSLYLADLDAIEGRPPKIGIYRQLAGLGLELWIDAGLRDPGSTAPLLELDPGALKVVVGLETVQGPRELAGIVERVAADRTVFSLDLFEGRPLLGGGTAWNTTDPLELARCAIEQGVPHLLIIDLARVGTARGTGSVGLMAQIREAHPQVEVSVGGGVSHIRDVLELRAAGASGVLIASALHDGRIGRNELEQIHQVRPA
jgi:phosphoribosylformimino-5-aminoimidazole carboxamide ribotide isomerase